MEPTATNPTTGEKVVFRGGQWVPAGSAPAPQAPQPPSVIQGRPKQTSPAEAERLRLAQEASDRAARAEDRANRAENRAERSEQRQAEQAALGTESERTAGFLAGRVKDATLRLTGAATKDPSAQNPTLDVEAVRSIFGDTAANYLTDEDRQVIRAAQIDIIDAGLTLGTGAAYTKEQLEGYREIYFPKLGDSEATIASKREALRSLLVNAQTKAGRAAPDIEAAIAALDGLGAEKPADAGQEGKEATFALGYYDESGNPLPDDFEGGVYDANGEYQGLTGRVSFEGDTDAQKQARLEAEQRRQEQVELFGSAGGTLHDMGALGAQGISLGLSDEAAGIGGAIVGLFNGRGIEDGYTQARNRERARADIARENLGWGGTALELAGAGGGAKVASGLARTIGAGRNVAASGAQVTRPAVQNALVRQSTREGATLGALGGFGYGEGAEGSSVNALLGAAAGGVVGNVGQRVGNALANRQGNVEGAAVQRAADELGIETIPAVVGGTTSRRLTSGARQGFVSDRPIAKRVDRMEEQGMAARDMAAEGLEEGLDAAEAGEVVRAAANVFSKRTSTIGGNLYARADRKAGGIELPLPSAIQAADAELAQLAKAPGGAQSSLYKDIKALRDSMASGKFEVDGIRAFRTRLRNELTERGLRGTPQDVTYGRILEAAENDMMSGLRAAGKDDAAQALRTASAFWKKRVETIDEVLEPVLGKNSPKSGEQILTSLERLANPKTGDSARLRRLFEAMPEREASAVRATIINRLGRKTPGAADNADEATFSFNTFLTNWNNMSPKAKATLFPKESREALDKLAVVSRGVKEAGGAMNTSNTAGALVSQGAISGALWWIADPLTALGAAGGQYMIGKLLASPKVARIIAGAPKVNTRQARRALSARLGNIAKAEPAIANEIGLFQRALAANDNPASRLAAEDE